MRRDAWRQQAGSYPLGGELQPRYIDVDVWQHLNNAALTSMHGEAVQQALRSVFGAQSWRTDQPARACLGLATDFLAEGHYPGTLSWGAKVCDVSSDDGLRIATALFQHGRCISLHEARVGGWADGRAVGLGAAARDALSAAAVPGADTLAPDAAPLRHHASPPRSAFPWHTRVLARFADSDARRLASDHWLSRSAEQSRVEFLDQIFSSAPRGLGGMMVAHVGLTWLRRTAPAGQCEIGCGVAHLGSRSVAMRAAMYEDGECVAVADSVMVAIDTQTRRSVDLSDGLRERLAPWRMHTGEAPA